MFYVHIGFAIYIVYMNKHITIIMMNELYGSISYST